MQREPERASERVPDRSLQAQVELREAPASVRPADISEARVAQRPAPAPPESPASPSAPADRREDRGQAASPQQSGDRARRATNLPAPGVEPRGRSVAPAAGRAEQVENAIRLENATGGDRTAEPLRVNLATPHATLAAPQPIDSGVKLAPNLDAAQNPQQLGASPARPDEPPMTSRLVRGLTAMISQRGGSLTMRLDPPDLGSLRVQMTLVQGSVAAHITASTAQAHGLLEQSLATLRSALESHGLSVERLSVQLSQPTTQNSTQQHQQDASHRQHTEEEHADAGNGQSRGRRDETREASEAAQHPASGQPVGFSGHMRSMVGGES